MGLMYLNDINNFVELFLRKVSATGRFHNVWLQFLSLSDEKKNAAIPEMIFKHI